MLREGFGDRSQGSYSDTLSGCAHHRNGLISPHLWLHKILSLVLYLAARTRPNPERHKVSGHHGLLMHAVKDGHLSDCVTSVILRTCKY